MSFSNNYYNSTNPFDSDRDASVQKSIMRKRSKENKQSKASATSSSRKNGFNSYSSKTAERTTKNISPRMGVVHTEDIGFTQPIRRAKSKAPAVVKYLKKEPKKASAKNKSRKKYGLLIRLAWLVALFLFVRLVFVDRGMIDYYSKNNLLNEKSFQFEQLKKENVDLVELISKIKSDTSFQKKLARDHLGVIDHDEFLILFAKERGLSSI